MEVARLWRLEQVIVDPKIYGCECGHKSIVPNQPVCPGCGQERGTNRIINKNLYNKASGQNVQDEEVSVTSVKLTNPNYYRKSEDQNVRDVINYSEILKPGISVEKVALTTPINIEYKVAESPTEVIIYEAADVMVAG